MPPPCCGVQTIVWLLFIADKTRLAAGCDVPLAGKLGALPSLFTAKHLSAWHQYNRSWCWVARRLQIGCIVQLSAHFMV
jgi:hypothetical protein